MQRPQGSLDEYPVNDLVDELFTLTTTIALPALFSSQLDPARAKRLRRAFHVFLHGIYTRAVLP